MFYTSSCWHCPAGAVTPICCSHSFPVHPPAGSLLAVPAGMFKADAAGPTLNATYCPPSTPLYLSAGSLLAVPAGMFKADAAGPTLNATYIFARGDW